MKNLRSLKGFWELLGGENMGSSLGAHLQMVVDHRKACCHWHISSAWLTTEEIAKFGHNAKVYTKIIQGNI